MHTLFLIHRYPPALGGSERFVQEIARRLVAEGQQATVYTSDLVDVSGFWQRGAARLPAGREDDQGVVVHRFRARVLPLHSAVSRLLGLIPWDPIGLTMTPPGLLLPGLWRAVRAGGDFDWVHAGAYPAMMYLGAVAARRAGARLALMPCSHPPVALPLRTNAPSPRPIPSRESRLLFGADALFALTGGERRLFLRSGVPAERVHVVGAGVNPQETKGANGARFRRRFNLPPTASLIAFIGHKTEGKGALLLLDTAQRLLTARPALTFALVGATTPQFKRRYQALPPPLRERILDLHLSEQEKQDLLAASAALVLPSRDDSFGIVLLEAWLHGKPVVGARAGGIPDVIQEGETGLLVPWGDAKALAQAIIWLLDHPAEAVRMGAQGREQTLRRWTWNAVYERVRRVYTG